MEEYLNEKKKYNVLAEKSYVSKLLLNQCLSKSSISLKVSDLRKQAGNDGFSFGKKQQSSFLGNDTKTALLGGGTLLTGYLVQYLYNFLSDLNPIKEERVAALKIVKTFLKNNPKIDEEKDYVTVVKNRLGDSKEFKFDFKDKVFTKKLKELSDRLPEYFKEEQKIIQETQDELEKTKGILKGNEIELEARKTKLKDTESQFEKEQQIIQEDLKKTKKYLSETEAKKKELEDKHKKLKQQNDDDKIKETEQIAQIRLEAQNQVEGFLKDANIKEEQIKIDLTQKYFEALQSYEKEASERIADLTKQNEDHVTLQNEYKAQTESLIEENQKIQSFYTVEIERRNVQIHKLNTLQNDWNKQFENTLVQKEHEFQNNLQILLQDGKGIIQGKNDQIIELKNHITQLELNQGMITGSDSDSKRPRRKRKTLLP